jgi:hypothetical protein
MFGSALTTALKILMFRAGPQDMPFSPQLPRITAAIAILSNALVLALFAPPWLALTVAIAAVFGVVFATDLILRSRQLSARLPQTLSALLLTNAILNLLLLWPTSSVAPVLLQVAKHPELLKQQGALDIPAGASLAVDLINLWALMVSAHIYRAAAKTRLLGGVGFALLVALTVLAVVFFIASLAGLLTAL